MYVCVCAIYTYECIYVYIYKNVYIVIYIYIYSLSSIVNINSLFHFFRYTHLFIDIQIQTDRQQTCTYVYQGRYIHRFIEIKVLQHIFSLISVLLIERNKESSTASCLCKYVVYLCLSAIFASVSLYLYISVCIVKMGLG